MAGGVAPYNGHEHEGAQVTGTNRINEQTPGVELRPPEPDSTESKREVKRKGHPLQRFERPALSVYRSLQHAFVIMPFEKTESLDRAYTEAIRPIVQNLGLGCVRTDDIKSVQKIGERIEKSIRNAYFVIADLTSERPNCYYELGFAQALKRPAILVAQKGTELHFDVRDYPCIFYESEEHLRRELLKTIVDAILTSPDRDPDEDPRNGEFGRCAVGNGRLLTAKILRTYYDKSENSDLCDLRIDVIGLPGEPPLNGFVKYYVHPSYTRTHYRIDVEDGYASLEMESAAGAFTVGVLADGGDTRLELDLATIPGAPSTFYPQG